jgi:hypothetical protein
MKNSEGTTIKKCKIRMATTHVDLHGERLSLEVLNNLACQINERYLPISVNHDIRQPTVGRLVSAEVVKMEDGEYAVDGIGELFEPTDTLASLIGDGRKMNIEVDDVETFSVHCDRSFRNEEGKVLLQELEDLSGQKPQPTIKKALEPISILVIGVGIFALGGIAAGFFSKFGEDIYDKLKKTLANYYKKKTSADQILDFRFSTEKNNKVFEVHVLISSPSEEIINDFFSEGISKIDKTLDFLDSELAKVDVAQVVLQYKDKELTFSYAVRSDCVPLSFTKSK